MKRFSCPVCRQRTHFKNTLCLNCGTQVVYDPDAASMLALDDATPCGNRALIDCNWQAAEGGLCECCAASRVIPDLTIAGNLDRWRRLETEKRRLYYSLRALGLPRVAPSGKTLSFSFLGDQLAPDGSVAQRVMTGHENGAITLNIAEADDDEREARRVAMGEPYRTLLGHLRHEVGHYYWEVLIRDAGREEECARLFGDADQDYAAALQRHYADGAPPDWAERFISSYAAAHPWEDWAETWAHMLHIIDGLDTARSHGIDPSGMGLSNAYAIDDAAALLAAWTPVAEALNAMNRSLGHGDFYPFVIPPPVAAKIGYMLALIHRPLPAGG